MLPQKKIILIILPTAFKRYCNILLMSIGILDYNSTTTMKFLIKQNESFIYSVYKIVEWKEPIIITWAFKTTQLAEDFIKSFADNPEIIIEEVTNPANVLGRRIDRTNREIRWLAEEIKKIKESSQSDLIDRWELVWRFVISFLLYTIMLLCTLI